MKAVYQVPLMPLGEPGTFGRFAGQPVLFDGGGLPCTRADLEATVRALEMHLAALADAVTSLQATRAARLAEIATLAAMEADRVA